MDFARETRKERLIAGCILVAQDALGDPNFDSTVVLLCQYGSNGAYGLVLNRPSHMPLSELFEHPPKDALAAGKNRRVYLGGPVQTTELQILQVGMETVPGSSEIAPGVHLGGAWNDLEEILARDPKYLRLFLGYSGWGTGQLEKEVEIGAWEVYQVDLYKFLLGPEEPWFGGSDHFRRFVGST